MKYTKTYLNDLIYKVNGAAIEVHKAFGPGLLESVYHKCMMRELDERGVKYVSELSVNVNYKGTKIDAALRCDLFVENILVVELKAVKEMHPIFDAQILTYMKLLKVPKGLMINFNVTNIFKNGQKTLVNEFYFDLEE